MKLGFGKKKDKEMLEENIGKHAEGAVAAEGAANNASSDFFDHDTDLSKLKKKDLLEIMLRQGEEIDSLRAQVAELQAQLEDHIFKMYKVGSIAEASLQVTKIFEEAEKAAMIYLENIRSKVQ